MATVKLTTAEGAAPPNPSGNDTFPLIRVRNVWLLFLLVLLTVSASCSSEGKPEGKPDGRPTNNGKGGSPPAVDAGNKAAVNDAGDSAKAKAIVAEMKEAYASCESYTDEGTVQTAISAGLAPGGFTTEQRFFTAFARPDCLRFELRSPSLFGGDWAQNIVWARGDKVRQHGLDASSLGWPGLETGKQAKPSWKSAIRSVALVSEVPLLLMPKRSTAAAVALEALCDLKMLDEETVDGVPCYQIGARIPDEALPELPDNPFVEFSNKATREAKITLWIEKDRKVLRKIHQSVTVKHLGKMTMPGAGQMRIPDSTTNITTSLSPSLNVELAWHELAFGAPGVVKDDEEGTTAPRGPGAAGFKPTKKGMKAARKAGEKIVRQMQKTYATCESYKDKGMVEAVVLDRMNRTVDRAKFRTAFVRPDRLRLEGRGKTGDGTSIRFIFWTDGGKVRSWGACSPSILEWDSLAVLFKDTSMETKVPVDMVPRLLMPQAASGSFVSTAEELRLLGYQQVDGTDCYKIRGRDRGGFWFSIWIEKKSKLLRRIEARSNGYGWGEVWITTTYKPQINEKVSESDLKLKAPE
ncbi:MAG: hypothetical protein JXQ75_14835 [Phycisphaerae bacterium]|nr:hypothetical protein [Phycisphaerae bacterium]